MLGLVQQRNGVSAGLIASAADDLPCNMPVAWCEDAAALHAAVAVSVPLIVIPGHDRGAAVLDMATAKLSGQEVALVRIRSTPASPLSVGQVVAQLMGGTDHDPGGRQDARGLLRALHARNPDARRLVVAVEGAHTLAAPVTSLLRRLSHVSMPVGPQVQIVFVGGVQCYVMLAEDRFRAIREAVRSEVEADLATRCRRMVRPSRRSGAAAMGFAAIMSAAVLAPHWYELASRSWTVAILPPPALAALPRGSEQPYVEEVAVAPLPRFNDPDTRSASKRRKAEAIVAPPGKPARRQSQAEQDRALMDYITHRASPTPARAGTPPTH